MNQEPFDDIPLFRELQRLLSSSGTGPVNFEIAKQVAHSIAREGGSHDITDAHRRTLLDSVHDAEGVLSGFTRLQLTEPILGEAVARAA